MAYPEYSLEELIGSDLEELKEYLHMILPFSVNMMAAIRDYPMRCRIIVARRNKEITGSLVEFHSGYNGHIWFDPIRWVSGDAEVASILVRKSGIYPSINISESDFSSLIESKAISASVFEEFIMVNGHACSNISINENSGRIRQLTVDDAEDSLVFSGYGRSELMPLMVERERRFLRERTCLGLFLDGKLVSRGAIMSETAEFSSLGAFRTDESFRKQGFGSRIILATLRTAKSSSESSCLFVRTTNTPAINVYSKLGFGIRKKVFFTDMGTGLTP